MSTRDPDDPQWDVPGWDWDANDYSWMRAGVRDDSVSIFFIHGGRIRHQADIEFGYYSLDEFAAKLKRLAAGLDDPRVIWLEDTGGGEPGLWVEGTRAPNEADLNRLRAAREHQDREDRDNLREIRRRHPDWFADGGSE